MAIISRDLKSHPQSQGNGAASRRPDPKVELWQPAKPKPAPSPAASGGNKNTLVPVLLGLGLIANIVFTAFALATALQSSRLPPPPDERVTTLTDKVTALSNDISKQRGATNRQAQELARMQMDLQSLNIKIANLPLPPDPGHRSIPVDSFPVEGAR